MSVKASSIIDKVQLYIEDHDAEYFTRGEVLSEINSVRREHYSSLNDPYVRVFDQAIYEGKTIYQYPTDLIRATHMYITFFDQEKSITERYLQHGTPASINELGIYRERVSSNEYELLPQLTMEGISRLSGASGNTYSGAVPDSGTTGDLWADDDGVIHRCETAYNAGFTELTLTTGRATPLVLTGTEQTAYIEVEVISGGATGASVLSKSGSGVFGDPLKYAFTLYDDDSSNDSVIALLSSDLDLTASGADANNVSVTPYASTRLSWTHEANWAEISLKIYYNAETPDLVNEDDELHSSITNPLRSGEALAKLASANLLTYLRGDPNSINAFRSEGLAILSEARHQSNRRMGPVGFTPGYRRRI